MTFNAFQSESPRTGQEGFEPRWGRRKFLSSPVTTWLHNMGRGRVCCGTSLHLYSGSSRFESQSTCSLYRLRVFVSFLSSSYHSKLKEVMTVPFHILTHPPFMIIFILITIAPKRSTVVMTQAAFGRNGDGNVTIPGSGPWYLYIR